METKKLIHGDSVSFPSPDSSKIGKKAQGSKKLGSIRNPDLSKRPCLSCNSRRVRCDLTKPKCNKCTSKNLNCTYDKPFIFIYDHSSSIMKNSKLSHTGPPSIETITLSTTGSMPSSVVVSDDEVLNYSTPDTMDMNTPSKSRDDRSIIQGNGDRNHPEVETEPLHGTWNFYRDSNINSTLKKTASDLSQLMTDVTMEFVLRLYDHFEDVILDYMVCFDSPVSPYRFVLLSRGSISVNLLITICSISLTNFESGENSREITRNFSVTAFKYSEISYTNLVAKMKDEKLYEKDINEIALILDDCLNILMQLSQSIFVEKDIINISPTVFRKYLKVVHEFLLKLVGLRDFPRLSSFNKSYLVFTVQRFLVNDILLSIVNDWPVIVVDRTLIDYVKSFEDKLLKNQLDFKMLTFLEFSACPLEILEVLFETQYYSKNVDQLQVLFDKSSKPNEDKPSDDKEDVVAVAEEENDDDDDDDDHDEKAIINSNFLATKTEELQNLTNKVSQKYEYYFNSTYPLSSVDMTSTFMKIIDLFSNTALILIYDKLMRLPQNSPQFIHLVDENLKIITQDISIGSGPDSCVYFPLMITAQRTILSKHRKAINMYFDVSHWHLQLGCQVLAQQVLNDYFWSKDRLAKASKGNKGEDIDSNYVIIY